MPDSVRRTLGFDIQVTNVDRAVSSVLASALERRGGYGVLFNTHMCSEAHRDLRLAAAVRAARWAFADGRPIYWMQRLAGDKHARQVRGTDLTWAVLAAAERSRVPVGFFGGGAETLAMLQPRLEAAFPRLDIRLMLSPPHGLWTEQTEREYLDAIRAADPAVLFVALGCPRQELWMLRHSATVSAVMLGIGAAVDFCAGVKPEAPRLLQSLGLEWLHRLLTEPKRLWRRYLFHNVHFLALLAAAPLRRRRG